MGLCTKGKRALAAVLAASMLAAALPFGALAETPPETASLLALTDELGNVVLGGCEGEQPLLRWVQAPEDTAATRTQYEYDGEGRLAAQEKQVSGLAGGLDAVSNTYQYEDGRLTAVAHSNTAETGTEYRFEYDGQGRLAAVQAGGQTLVSYRYEGDQTAPAETLYANGSRLLRTYDAGGRVISSRWEGEPQAEVQYRYDSEGRPVALLEDGQTTRRQYDAEGRLTVQESWAGGEARRIQWDYDSENGCTAVTETAGGQSWTEEFACDEAGRLQTVRAGDAAARYVYGADGRLERQELLYRGGPAVVRTMEYLPAADGQRSSRVARWENGLAQGGSGWDYTYDGSGRIRTISDGTYTTAYTYDEVGQLVREDDQRAGKSWTWTYDAGGNILEKNTYAYSAGPLGEPEQTSACTYGAQQWGDLPQSRNGIALETDAAGNLLSDGVWDYTWARGRQLTGMTDGSRTLAFAYDGEGLRTQKTVDGVTWRYSYVDGRLTALTNGSDRLRIGYDGEGAAFLDHNGTVYFYLRNLQGDIVGLADAGGTQVVEYTYDAWGVPLAVAGPLADTLGQANPLRYRGYLYDAETELYYLESRYYDPEWGRFLSADGHIAAPGGALLGGNLFAYGLNDPVNTTDPTGSWPRWITAGFAALSAAAALRQQSLRVALTALAATAVYRLQVVHFDVRDALNIDIPLTREEAIEAGWFGPDTDPVGPSALFHQFTAQVFGENVKYVSPDGYREAVYDAWGQLVADVRDIGTYNFSPSGSLWGDIRHFLLDVVPWLLFGNDDGDPGPLVDGVLRLFW